MSAAQKATTQSGKDRDEKPKSASARGKATPEPGELPLNGVKDGRFYQRFRIAGEGKIPEATHEDNAREMRRLALSMTWRAVDETYTIESHEHEDGVHRLIYSIAVEPNLSEDAAARRADEAKAEKAAARKKAD